MSVSLSVSAEPTGLCFSGNIDSGPNVLQVFLRGKKQQITACSDITMSYHMLLFLIFPLGGKAPALEARGDHYITTK